MSSEICLSIENVDLGYDRVKVIRGMTLSLTKGEILCVLGSNGAGKSTLLRGISGLISPTSGKIFLFGNDVSSWPSNKIAALGLCHVPEGRGIFLNMTVEENLRLGGWLATSKIAVAEGIELALQYFPRLKERWDQSAATLSGGEQQMLAIGRALVGNPKLLILDEPSLGLAPQFIEIIFDVIKEINSRGVSIVLVEQNANQALEVSSRGMVIKSGVVGFEGTAKDLMGNPEVQRCYLGI